MRIGHPIVVAPTPIELLEDGLLTEPRLRLNTVLGPRSNLTPQILRLEYRVLSGDFTSSRKLSLRSPHTYKQKAPVATIRILHRRSGNARLDSRDVLTSHWLGRMAPNAPAGSYTRWVRRVLTLPPNHWDTVPMVYRVECEWMSEARINETSLLVSEWFM